MAAYMEACLFILYICTLSCVSCVNVRYRIDNNQQLKNLNDIRQLSENSMNIWSGYRTRITTLRHRLALKNLDLHDRYKQNKLNKISVSDREVINYLPNNDAPPFVLYTLRGKLQFPFPSLKNKSIIFMVFNNQSGFLECLWNSDEALVPLASDITENVHYVFIPTGTDPLKQALWMQNRLKAVIEKSSRWHQIQDKFHFVVQSVSQLGNWLPACLKEWRCVDHGCGFNQVLIHIDRSAYPIVLKRLDARYDWLPSPVKFGNKTIPLVFAGNGCKNVPSVTGSVAMVSIGDCSFYTKVMNMQISKAIGVVVVTQPGQPLQEMNCNGSECDNPLSIPATTVPYSPVLVSSTNMSIQFQNSPSDNFFMAIDPSGKLAEVGWLLYPSANFLVWQAQWMTFRHNLEQKLHQEAIVVPLFENAVMQGKHGIMVNVTLPPIEELREYSTFELHADLSCPGNKDTTCPHWDRTIGLHVCCDDKSPLCDMELGRWISPFRRRIGNWLTDVSPLLPLLTSNKCTFHMYTDPWASPWKPSVNLRFSNIQKKDGIYPATAKVLFQPGATFDRYYNSLFKPYEFMVKDEYTKVVIYAVITGHGSDENGCGEFCVTSHHFEINGKRYSITFDNAGTPLGCAKRVSKGVVPNEHGTWLYGRDGWCDGQQVDPWVIDITQDIKRKNINTIKYFGWFHGKDPDPKSNPGIISLYSYLIFYKKL